MTPSPKLPAIMVAMLLPACMQLTQSEKSVGSYPGSPRVTPIPVSDMTPRQKDLLGIKEGAPLPGRAKSNLFRTLMHHPDLFAVYDPMAYKVNTTPDISDRQRELIVLRTAWLYQGKFEWSQHYSKALAAGWTEADIERLKTGAAAGEWAPLDKALLQAVDQLVASASMDDATWAALTAHYSIPQIMTVITLVTHYHWVAMMTKSMGIQPDRKVEGF